MKYTKEEILKIIRANNGQYKQVDEIEYWPTEELTFDLTIYGWLSFFDFVDMDLFVKKYADLFQMDLPNEEWQKIILLQKEKTIGDFCEFISDHAVKPEIKSIILFGRHCEEASIFRYLMEKIKRKHSNIGMALLHEKFRENFPLPNIFRPSLLK